MKIRIVIADDHVMFRDGLRPLLDREEDMEVVGEADDGLGAVQVVHDLAPDVVIMDVSMPQLNGIEAAQQIRERDPKVRVIVLSMHSDRQFVIEAFRAGVRAYILKDVPFEDLRRVVRSVHDGNLELSPAITDIVITDLTHLASHDESSVYSILSARERQVLQMIAEGRSTKEIAGDLHLSAKTIESHRKQVMTKLDIHTVAGLTRYAIQTGLTHLS